MMNLMQLLIISLGLLLAGGSLHAQEKLDIHQLRQHLEQGNKYYKQGKYRLAAEEYKIVWENGRLPEAGYKLAKLYDLQLNENELAVRYYTEYINADPHSPNIDEAEQLQEKARRDLDKEKEWRERLKKENDQARPSRQEIPKPPEPPPPDKEGFNRGLARACLSCHGGFMGATIDVDATHPVGRVPKGRLAETVPPHVRFYKEGEVVCLSCHDPRNIHFEQGTPGKTYKVLRVDTGPAGEDMSRFCAMCHRDKSSPDILRETEEEGESIRRE
jgi:tetratricopeptide (TPR) repeat protein